jgi:hypothetical protein
LGGEHTAPALHAASQEPLSHALSGPQKPLWHVFRPPHSVPSAAFARESTQEKAASVQETTPT